MSAAYPPPMTVLEIPPPPHTPGVAFAVRVYLNLQGRPHDPVEAAERAAVFETEKRGLQ